jgi:hypothetical protein
MSASIQDQLDTLLKFEEWRAEKLLSPPEFDIAAYIEELQNEANRELLVEIQNDVGEFAARTAQHPDFPRSDEILRRIDSKTASFALPFATSKEISEV